MASKILFVIGLVNLAITLVNGYFEFEIPDRALDQNLYEEVLSEELCSEQIDIIRSTPLLTLQFADAGIRIPTGVLQGNTRHMGNYHQCINFNQLISNSEIQGKYCVIRVPMSQNISLPVLTQYDQRSNFDPSLLRLENETMRSLEEYYIMEKGLKSYTGVIDEERMLPGSPLSGLQLTLAVCVPKPCTTRQAMDSFLFNVSAVGFQYTDMYCRLRNDKPWASVDYVAIAVFSLLGLITFASTTYDLWHTFIKATDPKRLSVIGKSFSVYTNGRRLMTFSSGPDSVDCIDGIRALAMAWVLLGHSFTSELHWANPLDTFTWSRSWQSLWVVGAHFTVDTFFTLSGFLVVYTTVGKLTSKSLLKNLHFFYLHRLLRMFPLLATAVLLEASYINHMADGPDWNTVANLVNRCRVTWWSTLLHVQNYVNPGGTCIGQTWYLAIDVQLHILSPIILVWVLCGKKNIAWTGLLVGLLGGLTASTIYIFINKFPPVMVAAGRENEMMTYMFYYYINTLTRAPPFLVGMLFGYIVRTSKTKLTGVWSIVFWAFFLSFTTFLMYSNYPINQENWDSQFMSSFYNSFFRGFWGIAIGSLIYACVNGFGGPINWFLSLQVWKLHARLSYAMYLFHYMLMVVINSTIIAPVFFTVGGVTFKFLSHYALCLAVSFMFTLLIDAPFSTLFKLMLGGGAKKPVKKHDDDVIEPTKENEKQF